ncbi:MAG: nucleotidyltransferase domain-containing protein [Candidatus Bathyarchaeia archaeon]
MQTPSANAIEPLVLYASRLVDGYLGSGLTALYLRGSAARDDWVPAFSDIDLYVVVKDELSYQRLALESELRQAMQLAFPKQQVSCRVVTEMNVYSDRVGSYLTGLGSKLISGKSILEEQKAPTSIELQVFGQRYLRNLNQFWRKLRFQRNTLEDDTRRLAQLVLKSAQSILLANGNLVLKKEKAAELFVKRFANCPLAYVVEKANEIRLSWPQPTKHPEELSTFCIDAVSFLSGLESYLIPAGRRYSNLTESIKLPSQIC